ncbi:MAG: hypothetical protein A2542_00080 [Parcubacteria group bacterium RIFOXYD2_FULL_52_8]|nr:MAG: hypothetical protein A2542_00080 [Parcubacteria group bacterium RIFOXYD2_FULL_52_8]
MTPEQLQQLRARLVKDLDIKDLPESAQDLIIGQVTSNVLLAITRATESRIPPALKDEYARVQESGDVAATQAFLEHAIPGYDKLVTNVSEGVLLEYAKQPVAA